MTFPALIRRPTRFPRGWIGNMDPRTGAIWENPPTDELGDERLNPVELLSRRPIAPVVEEPVANPLLLRREGPIATEPIAPMGDLIPRNTQPLENIPAPASVIYNNKGRPLGAEGGFSDLSRNQALLKAQQAYKPGHSTKDLLLNLGLGFLGGGLPGVAVNGLRYLRDPGAMARGKMDVEQARTQEAINNDLLIRRQESDLADEEKAREYKDFLINRTPNLQTQDAVDPVTGNTIQMEYDPQSRRYVPSRTASGEPVIRRTKPIEKPVKPEPETVEVNVGGQTLRVKPGEALGYYGQIGRQDSQQGNAVAKAETDRNAALARAEQAKTAAAAYQKDLEALDKSAAAIITYAPLTQVDPKTGIPQIVRTADTGPVYDQKTKSPERLAYERQREDLQKKLEGAQKEWRDANADASKVYVPSRQERQPDQRSIGGAITEASLQRYAKDNGLTVEQARAEAAQKGIRILPR